MALLRTRIKFCGIRRPADRDAAVALGVDAIGLILVPASPRHVELEAAAKLRAGLPPLLSCVALFKDADAAFVQEAIDAIDPALLQFHGRESEGFCASFGRPYLKAIGMGGAAVSLTRAARDYASASALLLDGHAPGGMGGSGESFAWAPPPRLKKPLILAGGLTAANVGKGISVMRPFAVDVSSGIEARPGVKDAQKMRDFISAVQRADRRLNKMRK